MEDSAHGSLNSRRDFLRMSALGGAAALAIDAVEAERGPGETGLPKRRLGKTGESVSILCLGGWHIGSVKEESEAIRIMHAAIDEGLTIFDNAWDYHDGGSEEIMGKALAMDGKRDRVFLMTKNCNRDAKGTRQCLEDSLRRLKTDRIDLWQFHEINYDNDPDWIVEEGALAEALKAQEEGKVRFLGFTGHKSPQIHLKMLEKHSWDTVQMPINPCDYFYRSFLHEALPRAAARGVAALGMKSLAGGRLVKEQVCSPEEAIRFALSQPIASLVTGIESMEILKQNLSIARSFKPFENDELQALLARIKTVAGDGRHERFKSTQDFDSGHHRRQHGFG